MASTTSEKVLAIAPHLKVLDDTTIEMYIEDAASELSGSALEGDERAERYLAAHYGSITVEKTTREEIAGEIKVDYQEVDSSFEGLKSTRYGQEFLRISKDKNGIKFRLFS